jgi:hypothetical protein
MKIYLKYKLVVWKRMMICLNNKKQWIEMIWVLILGCLLGKLGGDI